MAIPKSSSCVRSKKLHFLQVFKSLTFQWQIIIINPKMKRSTTLVFILALFGGMASALPQSYLRGSSAACDSRRAYVDPTEEKIANFVYDPESKSPEYKSKQVTAPFFFTNIYFF